MVAKRRAWKFLAEFSATCQVHRIRTHCWSRAPLRNASLVLLIASRILARQNHSRACVTSRFDQKLVAASCMETEGVDLPTPHECTRQLTFKRDRWNGRSCRLPVTYLVLLFLCHGPSHCFGPSAFLLSHFRLQVDRVQAQHLHSVCALLLGRQLDCTRVLLGGAVRSLSKHTYFALKEPRGRAGAGLVKIR